MLLQKEHAPPHLSPIEYARVLLGHAYLRAFANMEARDLGVPAPNLQAPDFLETLLAAGNTIPATATTAELFAALHNAIATTCSAESYGLNLIRVRETLRASKEQEMSRTGMTDTIAPTVTDEETVFCLALEGLIRDHLNVQALHRTLIC